MYLNRRSAAAFLASILALAPARLLAHCDTLDGPVVRDARAALERGDATPALKWVRPERELEVRAAFAQASAVRGLGADARALGDRYFFETVVRVHREGEGAAYTGLKPAGGVVEPGIAATDRALEGGSPEGLVRLLGEAVERGLRERFAAAAAARADADRSLEDGRAYVAAYVELMHYAERLHRDAAAPSAGHDAEPAHRP
jgi:hypothetical protein